MNRALKTVTNLCEAKKYTMTNMRQISKVPAMNSFVFSLQNRVLLFNESDFQDTTKRLTCSLICIYQMVNVLLL